MRTALLLVIGGCAVGAVALTITSFRRRDDLHGLAGMTLMMVAAIPATVYASVTS
jgi:hypothetical protein